MNNNHVTRNPDLMTLEEGAAYLGQSPRWLYEALRRGDIPGGRLGQKWILSQRRLDDWLDSRFTA